MDLKATLVNMEAKITGGQVLTTTYIRIPQRIDQPKLKG